ncbi:MAG: hypothetical protein CMP10_21040 [Zetaproteobacteria bacterium]|nr:hypothetical protein [Pseudobdellovibrionaceae bacterium]
MIGIKCPVGLFRRGLSTRGIDVIYPPLGYREKQMKLSIYMIMSLALIQLSCGQEDVEYRDSYNPEYADGEIPKTNGDEQSQVSAIRRMLILGDSIATGVLNDTTIGDPVSPSLSGSNLSLAISKDNTLSLDLNQLIDMNTMTVNNSYVVDSIEGLQNNYKSQPSAFYGGVDFAYDQFSLSAQLGLDSSQVINAAIFGYRTGDVLYDAIPDVLSQNTNDIDLVVLEIGSNDFCSNLNPAELKTQFAENYQGIMSELANMPGQPKVLVIPVPAIPSILAQAGDQEAFNVSIPPFIQESVSCQELQQNYCPRIRDYSFNEGVQLVTDLNSIIEDLVNTFNDKTQSEFELVDEIAATDTFTAEMLSLDCFHPGILGHRQLGRLSYEAYLNFSKP